MVMNKESERIIESMKSIINIVTKLNISGT